MAPDGAAAAEMLLLRLTCVSDLPPPSELARLLQGGAVPVQQAAALVRPAPVPPSPVPASVLEPRSFAELVDAIAESGEKLIAAFLWEQTHLIRFEPGRIELRLESNVPPDLPSRLGQVAGRLTGRRWIVAVGQAAGDPTLAEATALRKESRIAAARAHPDLKALLAAFPGADIIDVRDATPAGVAPATGQKGTG